MEYRAPPYIFVCIHFRSDLLTDAFAVSKYLFSFSPVGITRSVCCFSSSSGFVLIGLNPFLLDARTFHCEITFFADFAFFALCLRLRFSCSDLNDFQLAIQYVSAYLISLNVFFVNTSVKVSVFWRNLISDLRCPFFLLFGLKYNWSRNMFLVYFFSTLGGYSVFSSAYRGLFFFLMIFCCSFLYKFKRIFTNRFFSVVCLTFFLRLWFLPLSGRWLRPPLRFSIRRVGFLVFLS